EALLNRGVDLKSLQPALRNGQFIGSVNSEVLFTVDPLTANRSGIKMQNLTLSWVNNVRSALGAPVVQRIAGLSASRGLSGGGREVQESYNNPYGRNFDRTHQANVQRSNNSEIINKLFPVIPEGMGRTLMGQASWYGPYFHGRRSADGSRYNMYEMTAAHKSLPFGTIVKVTNVNNKKECIVKITDRGPYIHGRIIDLSKAAAQQIGMLGSGVANVKVEVIGKIPRHIRRR
ncbi:MAG: septal ring lytic transglycosylase RlpA family protein, partial [Cyanobacteriota bacterium]